MKYPTGQHHEQQACLAFLFWVSVQVDGPTIYPVTQARNLGLVLDFFSLPSVSLKIIPHRSPLLIAVGLGSSCQGTLRRSLPQRLSPVSSSVVTSAYSF